MRKIIKRKIYDTDTAKQLACRYAGEYGDANGYEERLYFTNRGQYFIYGVGGTDSPYPQETIKPVTKEQADEWNIADDKTEEVSEKKKPAKEKTAKTKKPRKPAAKKAAKPAEPKNDGKA